MLRTLIAASLCIAGSASAFEISPAAQINSAIRCNTSELAIEVSMAFSRSKDSGERLMDTLVKKRTQYGQVFCNYITNRFPVYISSAERIYFIAGNITMNEVFIAKVSLGLFPTGSFSETFIIFSSEDDYEKIFGEKF